MKCGGLVSQRYTLSLGHSKVKCNFALCETYGRSMKACHRIEACVFKVYERHYSIPLLGSTYRVHKGFKLWGFSESQFPYYAKKKKRTFSNHISIVPIWSVLREKSIIYFFFSCLWKYFNPKCLVFGEFHLKRNKRRSRSRTAQFE